MSENTEDHKYDLIVVGGGLSAICFTLRYKYQNPSHSVLLIERDQTLGGRSKARDHYLAQESLPSSGFHLIGEDLKNYIDQVLKLDPNARDLSQLGSSQKIETVSMMVAQKTKTLSCAGLFSSEGFQKIGGFAAKKDFSAIAESLDDSEGRALSSTLKISRKSGGAVVLDKLGALLDLPSVWESAADCITQRFSQWSKGLYLLDWQKVMDEFYLIMKGQPNLEVVCNEEIVHAEKPGGWRLKSRNKTFIADKLVVAHSPWQVFWLPRLFWPVDLWLYQQKTRPISGVSISFDLGGNFESVPHLSWIMTEDVIAVRSLSQTIHFRSVIDYEMSIHSDAVTKRIKAVKRAVKKFLSTYPEVALHREHIALTPVAYAVPYMPKDLRILKSRTPKKDLREDLFYVGEGYGLSPESDENIMQSVEAALQAVLPASKQKSERPSSSQQAPVEAGL